jgi:hypothetical protein
MSPQNCAGLVGKLSRKCRFNPHTSASLSARIGSCSLPINESPHIICAFVGGVDAKPLHLDPIVALKLATCRRSAGLDEGGRRRRCSSRRRITAIEVRLSCLVMAIIRSTAMARRGRLGRETLPMRIFV